MAMAAHGFLKRLAFLSKAARYLLVPGQIAGL
jgi:hypothetical protein